MPSYRIGDRATPTNSNGFISDSKILRSLFELRKSCNEHTHTSSFQERTHVTFWNCQWSRRIIQSLTKLIVRDGQRFSSIKFFDCDIDNEEFAEILAMLLKYNATASLVIKGGRPVGNTSNESHMPLSHCESSLGSSSIHASILVALREGISINKNLKSLKLSGLNFKNAKKIARNADDNDDTVDNSAVDEEYEWCESLINKTTLRNLDLSDSPLSTSTVTNLSNALFLNRSLQSLNLSRCCLDDQSLSKILRSVKEHSSLTKLNLSRNFLGKSASTSAVDDVAELLQSNSSKLACLDISQQQQPRSELITRALETSAEERESERQRHQIAFANALKCLSTNTTLRRIDLSGNKPCLADLTSVKALSSCLVANTGLLHVDVSSCHLTPFGIEYLAQYCIPRCSRRLKSLILFDEENSKNCITESENWTSAQVSLYCGLQSNKTLETLGELDHLKSRRRIQHSLNLNRAGRRALMTDDLPLAAWSHVLARAGHIQYDNDFDDDYNSDNTVELPATITTNATTASVLFTLLQGPALLEIRR